MGYGTGTAGGGNGILEGGNGRGKGMLEGDTKVDAIDKYGFFAGGGFESKNRRGNFIINNVSA